MIDRLSLKRRLISKALWRNGFVRIGVAGFAAAIIFIAGVSVGDGQLRVTLWSFNHTQNSELPSQLDYSSVNEVYNALKANYDGTLTTTQLLDGLKQGLAESTQDPYTEYFNISAAKQFNLELNNSFSGVGAELGKDTSGDLIIIAPIKGFPADKAGLLPKDVITSINGESTSGMAADVAATKIRGPKETEVTLTVVRGGTQNLKFTITRDNIQLPSVTSKILSGNIGYMQISTFSDDTSQLAKDAANSFKQAGVKGVILDLRGNPGGMLNAAVDVSSLWLPEGETVVTEKGTAGDNTLTASGDNGLSGVPTVVLIDDGSASASEITAGALHDNGAARLIGVQSFGKGVVQELINFNDGSELKVTVASWYRPNGQNINKKGIAPDQTVTMSDADRKAGNDLQLQAAEAYLAGR